MEGELRFDCSACWHIFVDDDVVLYQAKTEKGEVWKAKPRDEGDTVVAALDVDEHVVLIKNTRTVGSQTEWTLRFAPGMEPRTLKGARGQHLCALDPKQESSILALKVKSPAATTVFIVSKNPPKELPDRFELIQEEPPPSTAS